MSKKYFKAEVSDPPLIMEVRKKSSLSTHWVEESGWIEIDRKEYLDLQKQYEMEDIATVVSSVPNTQGES